MGSSGDLGRLLLTGIPGWLTEALIESLQSDPPAGLTSLRLMTQPGAALKVHAADSGQIPVTHVYADLRDRSSLESAVRDVDSVFHAAGILHVRRTRDWYSINTQGTINLADCAIQAGVS